MKNKIVITALLVVLCCVDLVESNQKNPKSEKKSKKPVKAAKKKPKYVLLNPKFSKKEYSFMKYINSFLKKLFRRKQSKKIDKINKFIY